MGNKVTISIENLIGTVIISTPKQLKELESTISSALKSVSELSLETLEGLSDTNSQKETTLDKKPLDDL
jgi:hypothetical protein